jgi:hypothetical protein
MRHCGHYVTDIIIIQAVFETSYKICRCRSRNQAVLPLNGLEKEKICRLEIYIHEFMT